MLRDGFDASKKGRINPKHVCTSTQDVGGSKTNASTFVIFLITALGFIAIKVIGSAHILNQGLAVETSPILKGIYRELEMLYNRLRRISLGLNYLDGRHRLVFYNAWLHNGL
jgi:hypothetical protein